MTFIRAWAIGVVLLTGGAAVGCGSAGSAAPLDVDGGATLSGTVHVGASLAAPQELIAVLYDVIPLVGAEALAQQVVAADGSWSFPGLPDGSHYYVYLVAVYGQGADGGQAADGGVGGMVPRTVGPLSVPSSGSVDVVIQPAQLSVLESSISGGALDIRAATATLFDPATGQPSTGGETVSIEVGGTSVPMTWTALSGSQPAYAATFPDGTPAQATYTITTPSGTWQLAGKTPGFTPSITSPANGATIPSGQSLQVSWPPQSAADAELIYVYTPTSTGSWTPLNPSPVPLASEVAQTTIPGSDIPKGSLLVGAAFALGNCPASSDGCVVSEAVANTQVTAQ